MPDAMSSLSPLQESRLGHMSRESERRCPESGLRRSLGENWGPAMPVRTGWGADPQVLPASLLPLG